ncbi:Uncharacterised protein (plasmid) [Legionella adelaidensis]|uniref:Uncharacterized protein n=1 Tax=Legionella adelaidensis TaxID=45056 RepID=A0A0W0R1W1_9GAMM|nr:hypothetical protein [Legionella adelaidensis]KTC65048.1 hypothetical protein Lade_1571 [Legionella adelaidensis]VEH85433.1 Uncharacterised protein [Legionella adelaidensis]
MPSIGQLYTESRLIAKTINRIIVEPDYVSLSDWKAEAQLLSSAQGACLSSTTLLVKGKHVPTYGIDGRCYGLLFNAALCNIYDVSATDSNSNRISKLKKREERLGIDLLHENSEGIKTLDELSLEIQSGADGQMNEVLLDAWKPSCVGLFVRKVELGAHASPAAVKHYYQSLLEIALVKKYLIQAFAFPPDFPIYQYEERTGKLYTFPKLEELKAYAAIEGIKEDRFPRLFSLLDETHSFAPVLPPITVREYLTRFDKFDISPFADDILSNLITSFEPWDGSKLTESSILEQVVDTTTGINEEMLLETIERCQVNYQAKVSAAFKAAIKAEKEKDDSHDEASPSQVL